MVDDSLLHSVPQCQNPKRDEERGWLPREEILVSEGSEFALTVSELELLWRTCPPRLNHRPVRCSEEAMCLWTTNLNLIVEADCSKSARQRQYPKRLKRVQASTRAKMLRGPSKKRPPE